MSDTLHVSATGDIVPQGHKAKLLSVTLTPAAALSTAVVRTGGASGTVVHTLQAAASGNSASWDAADKDGVLVQDGIHVTITGAGALVDVEFNQAS